MTPHSFVLCADDYGMNAGVSRAILDLARMGRVSATSCMANGPDWPQAARDLAAIDVGVGLHLTLTWGRPLGPMPDLAPDGDMPPLGTLVRRALTRRLPAAEVAAEIVRQLESFEQALGRPPDFVDGHQHVHVLPGIRGALLAALGRRGLAGLLWLRDPADRPAAILARRRSAAKALFVGTLAAGFRRDAGRAGFATNAGFSGFSPFDPMADPAPLFEAALTRLGPRPLVMCHPGQPDPGGGADEIAPARAREYDYLASAAFGDLLARRQVTLSPSPV